MSPADVTTQVLEHDGKLEFPSLDIRVLEGPDRGLQRRLGAGGMRICTAAGSDLKLTDRTVSRLHCELRAVGGAVRIVDSGSTNGTYVDGVHVFAAELVAGARVRVGETVLGVVSADEPCSVEL
jgi:pSer/pThr/pTyr-binding forkhead associated (FHA) protein